LKQKINDAEKREAEMTNLRVVLFHLLKRELLRIVSSRGCSFSLDGLHGVGLHPASFNAARRDGVLELDRGLLGRRVKNESGANSVLAEGRRKSKRKTTRQNL
jgi:hypothetical protein